MPDKTPYEQFKEVARELYDMSNDELELPRAEEIRDQLDPLWYRLTKEEQDRFSEEHKERP